MCDPNNLSKDAACLWMEALQGVWIFFRIQNTRLLKVELDIIQMTENVTIALVRLQVTEVDTS